MLEAKRNIMINKAGGNAGKESKVYRISVPAGMVNALGVTPEDRSVVMKMENGKIIIEKA